MSRFLLIDIGAGTMDILYYDDTSGIHYKAVAKSPVLHLAETAARLPGNLLVTGNEMGGGAISKVLKQRAQEAEVIMTVSSAATVHHNLEKVRSWGITIIDDRNAEDLVYKRKCQPLAIGDLDYPRIKSIIRGFGVPFEFDIVGVCAQDHGRCRWRRDRRPCRRRVRL